MYKPKRSITCNVKTIITILTSPCRFSLLGRVARLSLGCMKPPIRKYLNPELTKTFFLALVSSHLDYCNCLLFGIPKNQTGRLQKLL